MLASGTSRSGNALEPAAPAMAGTGGSAEVSTLPAGVRGRASSTITAPGTMVLGSFLRAVSSTASGSTTASGVRATMYAARTLSPEPRSLMSTTACWTPGCPHRARSTSVGSIRTPRNLSWRSIRPRNSSVPSAR